MIRCATTATIAVLQVVAASNAQAARPAATGTVPGVVIAHLPASARTYIGSPGIVRLENGDYLAKHDEFGPGSTEFSSAITRVYRSVDRGRTWRPAASIEGLFWASIFPHRGAAYMIGTHHHHGHLVALKSTDLGTTWTTPRDDKSGLIRNGKWHTAPVPVITHAGRLWRAVEDGDGPDGWGRMYRPRVMSISVDGDLLDADHWRVTEPIPRDGGWLGGTFWCVLEGNLVADRSEVLRNILRSDRDELAAVATVSADGSRLAIDSQFDRVALPGSSKKLQIRWDESSGLFWALSNPTTLGDKNRQPTMVRNTLALFSSPDLRQWTMRCILLHHSDSKKHAFQYPDWIVEGDDLLVVLRTAYDDAFGGAARAHDANYLTFHRFARFRHLTPTDGVPVNE